MARILVFIFLAFLVWLAVRTLGASRKGDRSRPDADAEAAASAAPPVIETVTQCAWCGVHVPSGDAVTLTDGRVYCSEAHREAARQVAAPSDRGRP